MINFDDEIAKYEPILETKDVEASVNEDGFEDIMDMIKDIISDRRR